MTDDDAPTEFSSGDWVVEVTEREVSTLTVTLAPDGAVSGTRTYDDASGPVTGTWTYSAPVLTLALESTLGLSPQPVDYEIVLSGGSPLKGTDTEGHHFTLAPAG